MPQNMEREHEPLFYDNVYKANVKPWQSGSGTGQKFLSQYWLVSLVPNTIENCQLAVWFDTFSYFSYVSQNACYTCF